MRTLRLLVLILHLLRGLGTCSLIFPFVDRRRREDHIRRWSATLLRLCGVELRIRHMRGAQDAARALIVSNHVSWLDIFAINALHPCRFVAKAEIRRWPLIGWLCEQAGTIFIARGRLRELRHTYQGLVESLHDGDHVAFFPEGTVSLQGELLPFHANLFEAAIEAEVPVQPYALRYLDSAGRLHPAVRYIEPVTFPQSLWRILKAERITAELMLLPILPAAPHAHRRVLADQARATIARALAGASESAHTEPGA